MNKRGRLVSERLAYGEAIVGDSTETIDWVDDGYEIVAELKAAMHGAIDPGSVSEPRIRHWQVYGRGIDSSALATGRPRINAWLRENPGAAQDVAQST